MLSSFVRAIFHNVFFMFSITCFWCLSMGFGAFLRFSFCFLDVQDIQKILAGLTAAFFLVIKGIS